MMTIEFIIELLQKNRPEADLDLVRQAYERAKKAHQGQLRDSGEPYITHPLAVGYLLAEMGMGPKTIAAGLLHDVVEDTSVSLEQVKAEFGEEIAFLVSGVTNVSGLDEHSLRDEQVENLRRMLVATAKDIRVIIIKLCDRLHNMRTLSACEPAKRQTFAQFTLEVYAPLAHRMGMGKIKSELEDLSFLHLYPEEYQQLKKLVNERLVERRQFLAQVEEQVKQLLKEKDLPGEVSGRAKHFYSIYQKMQRDNKSFDEIYDLYAIRIIVETEGQCYAILGYLHHLWPPMDGRIKDYISYPKINDYHSLHTTVYGPGGKPVEFQIRTYEMHRVAEEGVAAHWRYKEKAVSDKRIGTDAKWLAQISNWLQDTTNSEEFIDSLKIDLFSDEIFVYSPKGDLMRLPYGSTPVDFAYKIHSDLGDHCQGAKVNNKYVQLDYKLQTGDVIEIITARTAQPSLDWLQFTRTARARSRIRRYLKESKRENLISRGKTMLSREMTRRGLHPNKELSSSKMETAIKKLGFKSLADLFVDLGFGTIKTKQILNRLYPPPPPGKEPKETSKIPSEAVKISEIDDILYRRARCCTPVPGETIVGIVTKGRGISIHREQCSNVKNYRGDSQNIIPLHWDTQGGDAYMVQIEVLAKDRQKLLSDLSTIISSTGTNIVRCQMDTSNHNYAQLFFGIEVVDIKHLDTIVNRLIKVNGVRSVVRRGRLEENNGHGKSK